MKTFAEFAAGDSHDHSTFDKLYACFVAYVGRERGRGSESAQQYIHNVQQCRKEYDALLLQGTITLSRTSASTIINTSLRQYTIQTVQGLGKATNDIKRTAVSGSYQENVENENVDNVNEAYVDGTAESASVSFSTAPSQSAKVTSTPTSLPPGCKRKPDVEGRAMRGGKQACTRTTARDANAVSLTTNDIARKEQCRVSHRPDDHNNGDSLDLCEIDELVAKITSVKHKECDTWVLDDECIPCLIEKYQEDSIKAFRRRELKKSEPADTMILAGTFAPWSPTIRMVRIFTHQRLKKLRESLTNDVDMIDIEDGSIQRAIRYKMNENESSALDELQGLKDRKLRMLFEQLIVNLPRKERPGYSEETLVVEISRLYWN
ncbi:hypothetical protein BGX28_007599 [Mortierella sp. GBA30]|nr:hypothetical protein BGX28_007599 [Mortierella sp. GBA30]